MSYQDVLDECLGHLQRGEKIDALMAAHPEHAPRLRADLAAVGTARSLSASLPPTSVESRQRFRAGLQAQRAVHASKAPPSLWPRFKAPAFAVAAIAAAVVALVVALGGVIPSDTAEAGTIEGVVVEATDRQLTLQTEDGIETVRYEGAVQVSNESGQAVASASVEPGQFVTIKGERAAGVFQARRIQLQATARLEAWCEQFASSCVELERGLSRRASECARDLPACQSIRSRLDLVRGKIAAAARLTVLQERCDAGQLVACREIEAICANNPVVCESLREWLRSRSLR